jgi:hypothetical protein
MKALLAAAVFVASVPLVSAFAAGPETKASGNPGDERICRIIRDRSSASRLGPRRLCMTRRQWNQSHDGAVEAGLEELSTRSQSLGNYEHGVTPAQKGAMPR